MMRRGCALIATLALLIALFPGTALARPGYVTLTWANAEISSGAWNTLELGWTTDHGITRHAIVDNDTTTRLKATAAKGRLSLTTTDFASFHIYFRDVSCAQTYLDDGTPYDHATAVGPTAVGDASQYIYYFADAGFVGDGCTRMTTTVDPAYDSYNAKIVVLFPVG